MFKFKVGDTAQSILTCRVYKVIDVDIRNEIEWIKIDGVDFWIQSIFFILLSTRTRNKKHPLTNIFK